MMRKNPEPDPQAWFDHAARWGAELGALRAILRASPLAETIKWGKPCYTLGEGNVAMLYAFKDTCAVGFFKGALLKDPDGLLAAPGENSQAMRMACFTSAEAIDAAAPGLAAIIREAVALEKAGVEVPFAEPSELVLPDALESRLAADPALRAAFDALTPGRRRAYALHIGGAKQLKTREARVDQCAPLILAGKGLNDPR